MFFDREQILDRKNAAHAKHQQNDTQLGQFGRQALIRHKARRKRPGTNACHQITHQRRNPETVGQRAKK